MVVRINAYRFPGWQLQLNGEAVEEAAVEDPLARLHVEVPPGSHRVSARFENTPIRSFGEWLSATALVAAGLWAWRARRRTRPGEC